MGKHKNLKSKNKAEGKRKKKDKNKNAMLLFFSYQKENQKQNPRVTNTEDITWTTSIGPHLIKEATCTFHGVDSMPVCFTKDDLHFENDPDLTHVDVYEDMMKNECLL